jgi:hypothetical protein
MATSALVSCSSENDTPTTTENKLPEAIANDFNSRCGDNTIEHIYTGSDFYRHTGQQETMVYSKNETGEELFVAYVDNVWNRTVQTLTDINELPHSVWWTFNKVVSDTAKYELYEIKEVSQACISGKYYELCYLLYDSSLDSAPSVPSIHTLVIDSEGRVLKSCGYELNNTAYVRPLATDISWISERYEGATVLAYVNDLGSDEYLVMHDGVVKSVLFDSNNIDPRWKETRYTLPEGATVPSSVLDTLHTLHSNFTYTEVTFTETPTGNYYTFVDGMRPDRLGYNIGVD